MPMTKRTRFATSRLAWVRHPLTWIVVAMLVIVCLIGYSVASRNDDDAAGSSAPSASPSSPAATPSESGQSPTTSNSATPRPTSTVPPASQDPLTRDRTEAPSESANNNSAAAVPEPSDDSTYHDPFAEPTGTLGATRMNSGDSFSDERYVYTVHGLVEHKDFADRESLCLDFSVAPYEPTTYPAFDHPRLILPSGEELTPTLMRSDDPLDMTVRDYEDGRARRGLVCYPTDPAPGDYQVVFDVFVYQQGYESYYWDLSL